jgi:hypothetical protein
MTKTASLDDARRFIRREGRLLERRVLATLLDGEDASGALDALAGYRNEDGGFGHGLEPDKRAPTSQPLDIETAFQVMDTIGRVDESFVIAACDFLASLGPGVGCLVPSALEFPLAPHWGEWALAPSIIPTAGLVAHLWRWGVDHPWREKATAFCWGELERGVPAEAHAFGEALAFVDAVPDGGRADALTADLERALPGLELFHHDPAPDYGLTPLHYASSPSSRWLVLFGEDVIARHLDALAGGQREDGGWAISWETIGTAAVQEWRGIETLRAIRTLRAFGRTR